MKVVGSAARVFLRHLGAGVLALLLIGCVRRVAAGPVYQPFSQVLWSPSTYQAAEDVSLHAQRSEMEEESDIRLNVAIGEEKDHLSVCCLHANILDFYLNNVLNHIGNQHPRMHQLHSDLDRASEDLKARGCNAVHYRDHRHVARFRNKLAKMDHGRGLNKALSEVNILFTYLHDSCVSVTH